ncbi:MAG: DNA polymerase III subunit epsilon, partial [Alphaproteobacteria bacterium]|nr:DNA polymerase III subunit epsilon [Candidatus Fonsibacter sp. PEL55]
LDTETTGLISGKDRIVEIACIELVNHFPTKKEFHQYINPDGVKVTSGAFETHGYSDEFLSTKPKFKDIAKDFLDFIKDKKLIIHNADFDLGMINFELKKLSLAPIDKSQIIDTLKLAKEKLGGGSSVSLDALCKKFKIDYSLREKHTALLDCKLLAQVYIELIDKRELLLDLNDSSRNNIINKQNMTPPGIIIPVSKEQKEEYIKFLKKNVTNAFALEKEKNIN